MEIEEVLQRKRTLEENIASLISGFQRTTHLVVEGIDIEQVEVTTYNDDYEKYGRQYAVGRLTLEVKL